MVYWITGKSKSGKSTLARSLEAQLMGIGQHPVVIDGDEYRANYYPELGFERDEIIYHNLCMAIDALRLVRDGMTPIIACVSPFKDVRWKLQDMFRECIEIELSGGKMWRGTTYESGLVEMSDMD